MKGNGEVVSSGIQRERVFHHQVPEERKTTLPIDAKRSGEQAVGGDDQGLGGMAALTDDYPPGVEPFGDQGVGGCNTGELDVIVPGAVIDPIVAGKPAGKSPVYARRRRE